MRSFTLLILAAVLLILAAPRSSYAHAEVVRSTPEAGSTVDAPPAHVTAVFSQQVAPDDSTLTVEDASGARVDGDDSAVDSGDAEGKTMTVSLKAGLAAGTYTVRWNTLSAEDGETAEGRFTFTIRDSAGGGQAASPQASPQASASARPSASQSAAAASIQPSAAGTARADQATTLPETGVTAMSPWIAVAAVVTLILGAGIQLRRRSL